MVNKSGMFQDIERGSYGEFSKVKEEFLELEEALNHGDNSIHVQIEIADLLGAVMGFAVKRGFDKYDLIQFMLMKERYFLDNENRNG